MSSLTYQSIQSPISIRNTSVSPESSKAPISISIYTSTSPPNSSTCPVIFAHGASGSMHTPAVQHFATGLAHYRSVVTFQGNMNMKARVKAFTAVAEWAQTQHFTSNPREMSESHIGTDEPTSAPANRDGDTNTNTNNSSIVLAGRSMGSRAAILTHTSLSSPQPSITPSPHLILISYPLHAPNGSTRDQLLLDLPASYRILFITGTKDPMCPLSELEKVRKGMKAKSWLVQVLGADHGMAVRPKEMMQAVVEETGRVAGMWLEGLGSGLGVDEGRREGRVWVEEREEGEDVARWSGWVAVLDEVGVVQAGTAKREAVEKKEKKSAKRKRSRDDGEDGGDVATAQTKQDAQPSKMRKRKSTTEQSQNEISSTKKKQRKEPIKSKTNTTASKRQTNSDSVASRLRSRKKTA